MSIDPKIQYLAINFHNCWLYTNVKLLLVFIQVLGILTQGSQPLKQLSIGVNIMAHNVGNLNQDERRRHIRMLALLHIPCQTSP